MSATDTASAVDRAYLPILRARTRRLLRMGRLLGSGVWRPAQERQLGHALFACWLQFDRLGLRAEWGWIRDEERYERRAR